ETAVVLLILDDQNDLVTRTPVLRIAVAWQVGGLFTHATASATRLGRECRHGPTSAQTPAMARRRRGATPDWMGCWTLPTAPHSHAVLRPVARIVARHSQRSSEIPHNKALWRKPRVCIAHSTTSGSQGRMPFGGLALARVSRRRRTYAESQ